MLLYYIILIINLQTMYLSCNKYKVTDIISTEQIFRQKNVRQGFHSTAHIIIYSKLCLCSYETTRVI